MNAREAERAAARLRLAFDLFEAGEQMMRLNLRRRHPDESEPQIQARLEAWLHERPGAEYGDAEGRPGPWPRVKR
jgi:hypothetical protein